MSHPKKHIEPEEILLPEDIIESDEVKVILDNDTPVEKKKEVLEQLIIKVERFQGPIPHPYILKRYDEVVPGSASKILEQAMRQTTHRFEMENKIVESGNKISERSQWMALGLAILIISACIILALFGHDGVAGIIGGTTIVGIVVAFLKK